MLDKVVQAEFAAMPRFVHLLDKERGDYCIGALPSGKNKEEFE